MAKKRIDDLSDVDFEFPGTGMDMSLIDKVINNEPITAETHIKENTVEPIEKQKPEENKAFVQTAQKALSKTPKAGKEPTIKKEDSATNDVRINIDLDKYQNDATKRKQVLLHPEIYSRLSNFKSDMYIKNKIRIEYVDFVNKVIDQVLKHYGH